nr:MAG TPA: hypothetical protein [Caudoviricetes sp.]
MLPAVISKLSKRRNFIISDHKQSKSTDNKC